MVRTKEDFDSLPWAEIRAAAPTESIKDIFYRLIKPLGVCKLPTFRQWCVQAEIYSVISEDTKKQITNDTNARRNYTEEDDQVIIRLRSMNPPTDYRAIGEQLGRSSSGINARAQLLQKMGRLGPVYNKWSDENDQIIIDCLNQIPPMKITAIAKKLGRGYDYTRVKIRALREAGRIKKRVAVKKSKMEREEAVRPAITLDQLMPVARHKGLSAMYGRCAA